MRRLFILINLILLLAVLMFLAGCSRAKDPKEISIGYVNWSEGIAMSYLAKAMLEEQGYKVTLKLPALNQCGSTEVENSIVDNLLPAKRSACV